MSIIVVEGSNGTAKTTVIREMQRYYNFVSSKSVPDWFRKYIPFARSLAPELQKRLYMVGHEANNLLLDKEQDYIFDRFFYSTIIRLNYKLKKTVFETVEEISDIQINSDIIIYLKTKEKLILSRLMERENFVFDSLFFVCENDVFNQLSQKYDKMIVVENNGMIDTTVNEIVNKLQSNKIFLKRR